MHEPVVEIVEKAIGFMDQFLRNQIAPDAYAAMLNTLDVDFLIVANKEDFKRDATLVYYLDALMLLSSLQHQLDFQVAEYGANVASEDIKCLKELLHKFSSSHPQCSCRGK